MTDDATQLELDDIQFAAVQPRPTPYAGFYFGVQIADRDHARQLIGRLLPYVESAALFDGSKQVSLAVGLTFEGLKAIGVPSSSLETFPDAFRQGMAARAEQLHDLGDNAPENWEYPLGTKDLHVVIAGLAPDKDQLDTVVAEAEEALKDLSGVKPIWRQFVFSSPDEKEPFGFKDGIGQPSIEGTGIIGTNPKEVPLKAGEFITGYKDETGAIAPFAAPDILGRNGTYVAFRKLHTRVASFRSFMRDRAKDAEEEKLLAAKAVGRWQSGASLAMSPDKDDPELGADPKRNNAFMYGDDPTGLKCPVGSHARRMNPRDAEVQGEVRLHRMIRRGTNYGPALPPGVYDDDGADRGILFAFLGAHIERQFEFVQMQWVNDGRFIGMPEEHDPLVHQHAETVLTIPKKPIRKRFAGLPPFVVNRGGEYAFVPSLRALRWISDLKD